MAKRRTGNQNLGPKGRFEWINKKDLLVDDSYQREEINKTRVDRIRRKFWWPALGVLLVAEIVKGGKKFYYVYEGQHRKLSADEMPEIELLPCFVTRLDAVEDQALAFVITNGDRGPVKFYDKFRAMLRYEDATAIAVKNMVEATSYRLVKSGGAKWSCGCAKAVYEAYEKDKECCQHAWDACVEVCDGKPVMNNLFRGIFYAQTHMKRAESGWIDDPHWLKKLKKNGLEGIMAEIQALGAGLGKTGNKVCSCAVVRLLNYREKKTNQIPPVIPT